MPGEHILRLARTDRNGEYLLVRVVPAGGKPLDLKLVASENEHIYPVKIKEANVKTLQASNYSGDLDEWKTVLRYALLQEPQSSPLPTALQGLELVAALNEKTFTITLRKNIGGVHQRLGTIRLDQNDEEGIDMFDMASTAVATADELREKLSTLQASVGSQQEQVAKLNQQLDDLVKAKKDHEEELLKKFAALLNAKKLKIRDQQRLLVGAKIDPKMADAALKSPHGTKAGGSRKGKRKANGAEAVSAESEDDATTEDDEINEDERRIEQETPQQSEDDATEDDDDGNSFNAVPASSSRSGRKTGEASAQKAKGGKVQPDADAFVVPPRRELPFTRKDANVAAKPPPKPAPPVVDDDETDDDEL
ncbi:hypothetical protein LTR97_003765 [Elasticomyces elasticus]|uniref:Mitotic apparatus protein p62 n=1 Tax=Elasticomyces elasticus TaxID=574655 RepID=A0AAN7VUI1_9PEZI|nr:hypothetical protein LTR97_003765 [Elasticomyces elasticus]